MHRNVVRHGGRPNEQIEARVSGLSVRTATCRVQVVGGQGEGAGSERQARTLALVKRLVQLVRAGHNVVELPTRQRRSLRAGFISR